MRWYSRQTVLGGVAAVVGVSSFLLVPSTGGAASSASLPYWDPTHLPLLVASSGSGPAAPILSNDVVDGSLGLATSLRPELTWNAVPAGVSQARFTITTVASRDPRALWSGSASVNAGKAKVVVPLGILHQGQSFIWHAYSVQHPATTTPKHLMSVDVQRTNAQGLYTVGPVDVAEVSGEPVTMFTSGGLSTKEGNSSFSLLYRPTNPSEVGLPHGWKLSVGGTTSNWAMLQSHKDGSLSLISRTGESVTFVPADARDDSYRPEFGADQTWPNGSVTTLVPERQSNGSVVFTATEQNRLVTVFSPISATATTSEPTKIWSDGTTLLQQQWSGGRIQSITDPTSQATTYTFTYGGSGSCPSITHIAHAIAAPAGFLCGVNDWSGQSYGIFYIHTTAGPRIARIVAGVGAGENAQVTDYQWDESGRLVGVRPPSITSDVASGAVTGLSSQDPRSLYQISYDAQGRVASITPPPALMPGTIQSAASQERITAHFAYHLFRNGANPNATFVASVKGAPTTSAAIDPTTMLEAWNSVGPTGRSSMTWNTATGSLISQKTMPSGSATETVYNSSGLPIEQYGPSTGNLKGSHSPRTISAYDENASGQPWTGLATFYYNNGTFAGAPSTSSVGPTFSGMDNPPSTLAFTFPNPPAGVTPGSSGWSARMTGSYLVGQTGKYTFTNETSGAKVWMNGVPCLASCTFERKAGAGITIRIDLTATNGAPAIRLVVTTPSGLQEPVPSSALRPSLGYVTSETTYDSLSASSPTSLGAERKLQAKMTVDPTTGEVLSETTPAGSVTSSTFNADGSPATSVNAAGQVTTLSYYGNNESAAPNCDSTTSTNQRGMVRSVSRSGLSVTYINSASGGQASVSTPSSQNCSAMAGNSFLAAQSQRGIGVTTTSASVSYLGNDPMVSMSANVSGQGLKFEQSTVNLLGQLIKDVDEWGTTTTYTYDPATNLLTSMTQTTSRGATRVESYTYNASGQTTSTRLDGKVLETLQHRGPDGLVSSATLENGVEVLFHYGINLQLSGLTYQFPNGTKVNDQGTYSVGGRLLCDHLTAPDGTSTQCYQADLNGKITGANETGTLPVLAKNWSASYPGAQGANGDRASLTAELSTAGKTHFSTSATQRIVSASYSASDALAALNVSGTAQALSSDALGRTTHIGGAALTYDASGNILSVAQGHAKATFQYGPSGMDEETYTPNSTDTATHPPISVEYSGTNLLLSTGHHLAGQSINLASGATVGVNAAGTPVEWSYDGILGNANWRSTGTAPSATQTYNPWGELNSAKALPSPKDAVELAIDQQGWGDGQGAVTLPVSSSIIQMGARTYDALTGRFLQADPQIASDNLYAFGNGDPIDVTDPTGNFGSAGDIFSMLMGVLVGVAATVLMPVTGGASAGLYAAGIGLMVTAAADFGISVLGQVIDNGGFSNIDWAQAGINASISTAISIATFGIGRAVASPTCYVKHLKWKSLDGFKTPAQWSLFDDIVSGVKSGENPLTAKLSWQGIGQSLEDKGLKNTVWQRMRRRIFWNDIGGLESQAKKGISFDSLYGDNLLVGGSSTARRSAVTYNSQELIPEGTLLRPQSKAVSENSLKSLEERLIVSRSSSGSLNLNEQLLDQSNREMMNYLKKMGWD